MSHGFVLREAESQLFGVRIASLRLTSDAAIDQSIDAARAGGVDLAVARVDVSDRAQIRDLERRGAALCDTLVTYARATESTSTSSPNEIRQARATDGDALAQVAAEAFTRFVGHWHADRRLAPELADQLYVRWTRDLLRNAGDRAPLFVACDTDNDTPVAFLALAILHHSSLASVPLTAVAPASRGRGLLGHLLSHAMRHLHQLGVRTLEYETQLDNWGAQRTITRAGFYPVRARHTFHLWLSDAPSPPNAPNDHVPVSTLEIV